MDQSKPDPTTQTATATPDDAAAAALRFDDAAELRATETGRDELIARIVAFAEASGATATAVFDAADIELRDEVRAMCAADRCHSYGKNWMCPPYIGSLDEWRERVAGFSKGILIQRTCQLEDSFDYEAMEEGQLILKNLFNRLVEQGAKPPAMQLLTAGACTICATCTCPDAPCRFPDRAYPSLEAIGILVTDLCTTAGLPYYYGPNTLTWSGGVLV